MAYDSMFKEIVKLFECVNNGRGWRINRYANMDEENNNNNKEIYIWVEADAYLVVCIVEKIAENILFRLRSYVTQIMCLNQITVR